MTWQSELRKVVKGKVKFHEPAFKHTTWRTGGNVDALVEPGDVEDLIRVIKFSQTKKIPLNIIGMGSNLLVSDKGIRGIVVKFSQPHFKNIEFKNNFVSAGAGVSLNRLVNLAKNKGFSGCEFLAGIPGTLGGALVMNAGVKDVLSTKPRYMSISDLIKEVKVLDFAGSQRALKKKEIKFFYRGSNLSRFVVISAELKLKPKSKRKISALINKFASYKKSVQDLKSGSAGCVFKNPVSKNGNFTAGKLIDACGIKGLRLGNAEISPLHAILLLIGEVPGLQNF
jgi:UDP-N-acetylenolpyruvoylglucosamine reductase